MKNLGFLSILVLATCVSVASASAESVRHDRMDARAARADIARLKMDRRVARRHHNWGKVQQDNRLIAEDQRFIHKDFRKIRNHY